MGIRGPRLLHIIGGVTYGLVKWRFLEGSVQLLIVVESCA